MYNRLKNIVKTKIGKITFLGFGLIITLLLVDRLFPPPQPKEYSKVILDRGGNMLTAYLTSDDKWRLETKLDEITPEMIAAIIEKEDSWFYWHFGFNPVSIARAIYQNITSGKRVSGASTITMQLVRLLEPAERTYINKAQEIMRAVQLESHYSKDEILEMYLSYLPMGGNIEGVKSASRLYFNRPPGKLSLAQSVALAVIPNNPNKYRIDESVNNLKAYRNFWLNQYKTKQIFSDEIIEAALEEDLLTKRFNIPKHAPHFCYEVGSRTNSKTVRTFLNSKIQTTAEKHLRNHIESVRGKGISNGALLVIDNRTNEVVAYCGSADFTDASASGQVNGVRTVRSPGSALKPFVYAASLDNGLFTPKMKLLDIPTDYAGYSPENYDQTFNGEVSFHDALVNSLNVPAVRLLRKIGYRNFMRSISKLGFEQIWRQREQMGLSVILGGCGVTLEQLTRAYTSFANGGKILPLKYSKNETGESQIQIFSEAASYITSTILSTNERPDFPNILSEVSKLPRISWKTGTSYGKRDGWAVGFNKNYTIGVWVGNFDGKGSPYLSGKEVAVPLLFNLFNSIDYASDDDWFEQPVDVDVRKVCDATGLLPSENCGNAINDFYIMNISHEKKCALVREVYVSLDHKSQYCVECLPSNGYEKNQYKFYHPELINWYKSNNVSYAEPPAHNRYCSTLHRNEKPIIISPTKEMEYLVEKGSGQKILLQASSSIDVSNHYWYVNNKYFGQTGNSGKLFFKPIEGKNEIVCKNDLGAETHLQIIVKYF